MRTWHLFRNIGMGLSVLTAVTIVNPASGTGADKVVIGQPAKAVTYDLPCLGAEGGVLEGK